MTSKQIVFVGLSGGVDSSVAALRLLKDDYNVVGVFIKVWYPDFLECNWRQERLDAMRVAAKLGIPFHTYDASKEYKEDVADYFIDAYRKGLTPNPDVMCNKHVKFKAFLKFAEKHGADFIATGHYAQIIKSKQSNNSECYQMYRGVDVDKDQTYFLWTLTQNQLSKVLFPVGNSPKTTIREEAEKAGLITSNKKDSQGVCFLGQIDISEFLSNYIDLQQGSVLNKNSEIIGTHVGALVYTTGQRHGFTITSNCSQREAMYVIDRDIIKNTITVGTKKMSDVTVEKIQIHSINIIGKPVLLQQVCQLQIRYRQKPVPCQVVEISEDSMKLAVLGECDFASSGQSCVLYNNAQCIGGGIIV